MDENTFTGTQGEWEDRVIANAAYFRLHRFIGQERSDCEINTLAEAVGVAMEIDAQPGKRVLVYAVAASGRSTLVPKEKWQQFMAGVRQ